MLDYPTNRVYICTVALNGIVRRAVQIAPSSALVDDAMEFNRNNNDHIACQDANGFGGYAYNNIQPCQQADIQ
jgi:hypothetical protein